jgi:hypothetical protein
VEGKKYFDTLEASLVDFIAYKVKRRRIRRVKSLKFKFDYALGVISLSIGIVCLTEFKRLFPIRYSFLSGDHALLGLTGTERTLASLHAWGKSYRRNYLKPDI